MEGSKIQLSQTEIDLVCDAGVILTKNRIIQKTVALLEVVQQQILQGEEHSHGLGIFSVSPKISKGENYRGLPYIVLDYPRLAQQQDVLFIRTMFWWGNFFSSTLQLAGRYKQEYEGGVLSAYDTLAKEDYYLGISDDPWHHHFGESNYMPVQSLSQAAFREGVLAQEHLKIAAKWPLENWDGAAAALYKSWERLAGLIT